MNLSCGCHPGACHCCDGGEAATPVGTWNRPGLPALADRVGTHGRFLASMKARLSTMEVDGIGADGQTPESFRPLQALATRDPSDLSIALLDGWASVGDVLTFYQERISNEGYLRTATERRSVTELARLVGYRPRPGVAATVYLSYEIDPTQAQAADIPVGSAAQSTPGPGEQPQIFETVEPLSARAEWNNLPVRKARPQRITWADALTVGRLHLRGAVVLKAGDQMLLAFQGERFAIRTVASTEAEPTLDQTAALLQPVGAVALWRVAALEAFIAAARPLVAQPDDIAAELVTWAEARLEELYLGYFTGLRPNALTLVHRIALSEKSAQVKALFEALEQKLLKGPDAGVGADAALTDPSKFVGDLLKPRVPQALNALRLSRSLAGEFAQGRDSAPQMLTAFAPELKDSLYQAWANARSNAAASPLEGLAVFRTAAALFGATASKLVTYDDSGKVDPPNLWGDWPLQSDEAVDVMHLDQAYESVLPGSFLLIQKGDSELRPARLLRRVAAARTAPRAAYGLTGKSTALVLPEAWWRPFGDGGDGMFTLRSTQVYAQSEVLHLARETIDDDVSGREIELSGLYKELKSGRWIVLQGERADIPGVTGVTAAELMMVSGLRHGFDPTLPGDKTHTTLLLATSTAYAYKRGTLAVLANVVKATHGATRQQTLGSGAASAAFQSFDLRLLPLTYVPAPTVSGTASTLKITVNDVFWKEADSFAGQGAKARIFTTKSDDDGSTHVIFGDGETGARPPTGVENIAAAYRQGIGAGGNVAAGQVNLLLARPLGVRTVVNPLRASGGADREDRDTVRFNAPLAVGALDRVVSVSDYADFARTFAGIGKAAAARLSDGRSLVQLTVAGVDDIPIDATSDLYRNLVAALQGFGDPSTPVKVQLREAVLLVLSAKVKIDPDRKWEVVAPQLRATVLDLLGFRRRKLGEAALLGRVIAAMQAVPGVAWIDVDAFGGVPERTAAEDGTRRLLTLPEISAAVQAIVSPGLNQNLPTNLPSAFGQAAGVAQSVRAAVAGFENGGVRPAQIAMLSPDLPETLVLNQIA